MKDQVRYAVGLDSTVDKLVEAETARLREALTELCEYAASVWFDEATATDEERELMARSRAALASVTAPVKSG